MYYLWIKMNLTALKIFIGIHFCRFEIDLHTSIRHFSFEGKIQEKKPKLQFIKHRWTDTLTLSWPMRRNINFALMPKLIITLRCFATFVKCASFVRAFTLIVFSASIILVKANCKIHNDLRNRSNSLWNKIKRDDIIFVCANFSTCISTLSTI